MAQHTIFKRVRKWEGWRQEQQVWEWGQAWTGGECSEMRLRWLPFSHISLPLVASLVTQTSLSAHEIRQSALFSKTFAVLHRTLKFNSMLCEPGIRSETAASNLFFICTQTFCDACTYCRPTFLFFFDLIVFITCFYFSVSLVIPWIWLIIGHVMHFWEVTGM